MAAHFVYKHLPASGLGRRNPRRPYATGGLGYAVELFPPAPLIDRYTFGARPLDTLDGRRGGRGPLVTPTTRRRLR